MKQPGNGCNYDDAESRPDCISNTDRDGFQNQRKKIKCDAITDYDNGGRGKLSKALGLVKPSDMAKRMQDKESIAGVSWLIVLALSCWGGLVRYLIDVKQNKATWSWINALAQIAVSGFTGLIGGLISVESGLSLYMILVTSGISGAMGSVALTYFWERLTGMKNANQ